jgi:aldehyde:ferredoxin oxidoreductase
MEETVIDISKDRNNIGQHDIRIEPGSTLPTSKWAEYGVYFEAYQAGLIDRTEVLKKNPEIFDKESILSRMSEIAQLQQANASLEEQVKALQGDLQTAQRESVQDKKRVAVEKFKRDLSEVRSDAKANKKVQTNRFADTVKFELEKLKPLADNMQQGNGSTQEEPETS